MCIPIPHETGHTMQSGLKQGIPDSYKPCRTEPPKMHICSNFDFKAHFRRVYASMVHLTYNATKRRKMPIECKIELYTRYHPGMPCYFVPCYSVQIPEYCAGYARIAFVGICWTSTNRTVFSYEKGAARCSPARTRPRRSALPYPILTFSDKNEPEQLCVLRFRAFCGFLKSKNCFLRRFCGFTHPKFRVFQPDCAKDFLYVLRRNSFSALLLCFPISPKFRI